MEQAEFDVTKMGSKDFFSSAALESLLVNRNCSSDGTKISWADFQKIIYEKHNPLSLHYLTYGATSTQTISLQPTCTPDDFLVEKLRYLYNDTRQIAMTKYNDLLALIKYIPAKYHDFYRELKHDENNSTKDYALADKPSDVEEDI